MSGANGLRRAEDIGGQELSYAEVKAIASGNPAVLTLAEADAELQRLTVLKKQHADEQYLARRSLRELPETIARLKQRLSALTADLATAQAHANDRITIGSRSCSRQDAASVLAQCLETLPRYVSQTRRFPIGVFRGLRFGLILNPHYAPEVYLEGTATRHDALSRDHHGPRAVINALERLVSTYGPSCTSLRRDLSLAESQLRDYQGRMGTAFTHESYLTGLTALRDQLKAGLSGAMPEGGAESSPSVSELADQIKALKAAHTIEAVPQRAGKPRTSAEQPVTARIRQAATHGSFASAEESRRRAPCPSDLLSVGGR
jgi:hypothetical protein